MSTDNNYRLSYYKRSFSLEYPKNIKTIPQESFCLNEQGELLWCYFSSELGIFLKNMDTKITERIMTISELSYLDIDYNPTTSSYILFYEYKNRYFIKYLEGDFYTTKEILNIKSSSRVFMTYYKFSGKITLIYKDRTNSLISEINSEDDFQTINILKNEPKPKEEIESVGYNSIDGLLSVDLIVKDNSLLKDIDIHPLIRDKVFRYIPIDSSMFKAQ